MRNSVLLSFADDWVLLLYLVGNDFIPHLPNLHIDKGGLPMLFAAYKKLLEADGACLELDSRNTHTCAYVHICTAHPAFPQ